MARNEIRSKALTEVQVDGRNADQVLSELKTKADSYTRAMVEAQKANDLINYNKANGELKKTEKSMKELHKQTFDVNEVMKNLSGSTLKDLTRAKRQLQTELSKTARGTDEWIRKSRQLGQINGEIRNVRTEMNGVAGASQGMFGSLRSGFMWMAGAVGSAYALWRSFTSVMKTTQTGADSLERTMQGLKGAITGLQQTIATGDWSNLVQNMKNGYMAAANYADALDELADRMRAVDVRTSEQKAEMEELRNIMASTETASIEDREKAQERYMQLNEEILIATKKNADLMIQAERERLKEQHGINDEQVESMIDFVRNYDILTENELKAIKKVLDAEKNVSKIRNEIEKEAKRQTQLVNIRREKERESEIKSLNELVITEKNGFSEREQAYYNLTLQLDKFVDVQRDDVAKALKSVSAANTQFESLQRNAVRRREALEREKKQRDKEGQKAELEALEQQYQKILLEIDRTYLEEHRNKDIHNKQIEIAEWAHLEARIAMYKHFGMETTDLEKLRVKQQIKVMEQFKSEEQKISDKLIEDNFKATADSIAAIFDETEADDKKKAKLEADALERFKKNAEQYNDIALEMGSSLGQLIGEMAVDAELTAEQFGKNLLVFALDTLQRMMRIYMAEAGLKNIARFGLIGGAAATALQMAAMESIFAAAKAVLSQRATGKYDVIGAEDGRTYRNVPYGGTPKTGLVTTPTIYGERGDELVVDNRTLRNLRINFPTVLPAIRAAMVPQRADGNVGQMIPQSSAYQSLSPELNALIVRQNNTLTVLTEQLKDGIQADISYKLLKERLAKAEAIERSTNRTK